MMNYENKNELETSDITCSTKPLSLKNECDDIGKKWVKCCPKCGKEQRYSCKSAVTLAQKRNTLCNICLRASKQKYPDKTRTCPTCNSKISYKSRRGFVLASKNNTECRSCWCTDREKRKDQSYHQNIVYRKKLSDALKIVRKDIVRYGDAFKEKCRKNRAIQLEQGIGGEVNYNASACVFIDLLNSKNGWNLVHACNGGEKMVEGFFLDGWDEIQRIAFEYDEPKHHTISQKERDKIKENVVKKYLSPKEFWRYDEKKNLLYEIISGKECKSL